MMNKRQITKDEKTVVIQHLDFFQRKKMRIQSKNWRDSVDHYEMLNLAKFSVNEQFLILSRFALQIIHKPLGEKFREDIIVCLQRYAHRVFPTPALAAITLTCLNKIQPLSEKQNKYLDLILHRVSPSLANTLSCFRNNLTRTALKIVPNQPFHELLLSIRLTTSYSQEIEATTNVSMKLVALIAEIENSAIDIYRKKQGVKQFLDIYLNHKNTIPSYLINVMIESLNSELAYFSFSQMFETFKSDKVQFPISTILKALGKLSAQHSQLAKKVILENYPLLKLYPFDRETFIVRALTTLIRHSHPLIDEDMLTMLLTIGCGKALSEIFPEGQIINIELDRGLGQRSSLALLIKMLNQHAFHDEKVLINAIDQYLDSMKTMCIVLELPNLLLNSSKTFGDKVLIYTAQRIKSKENSNDSVLTREDAISIFMNSLLKHLRKGMLSDKRIIEQLFVLAPTLGIEITVIAQNVWVPWVNNMYSALGDSLNDRLKFTFEVLLPLIDPTSDQIVLPSLLHLLLENEKWHYSPIESTNVVRAFSNLLSPEHVKFLIDKLHAHQIQQLWPNFIQAITCDHQCHCVATCCAIALVDQPLSAEQMGNIISALEIAANVSFDCKTHSESNKQITQLAIHAIVKLTKAEHFPIDVATSILLKITAKSQHAEIFCDFIIALENIHAIDTLCEYLNYDHSWAALARLTPTFTEKQALRVFANIKTAIKSKMANSAMETLIKIKGFIPSEQLESVIPILIDLLQAGSYYDAPTFQTRCTAFKTLTHFKNLPKPEIYPTLTRVFRHLFNHDLAVFAMSQIPELVVADKDTVNAVLCETFSHCINNELVEDKINAVTTLIEYTKNHRLSEQFSWIMRHETEGILCRAASEQHDTTLRL